MRKMRTKCEWREMYKEFMLRVIRMMNFASVSTI